MAGMRTKHRSWLTLAAIICLVAIYLITYLGLAKRSQAVDVASGVETRIFKHRWQVTFFGPAAIAESAIRRTHVQTAWETTTKDFPATH